MSFEEAIQSIERRLSTSTVLVSDATIILLTLLRSRKNSASLGNLASLYDEAVQSLTKELLGYEAGELDATNEFRTCHTRIARVINDTVVYLPEPPVLRIVHMLWGSQQVEASLADVLDLNTLASGNQELISREIKLLSARNPLYYTESGVKDIWIIFNGMELLRLYFELHSMLLNVCNVLLEHERRDQFVTTPQISQILTNIHIPF